MHPGHPLRSHAEWSLRRIHVEWNQPGPSMIKLAERNLRFRGPAGKLGSIPSPVGPGGDPTPMHCALLCVCSYWLASALGSAIHTERDLRCIHAERNRQGPPTAV